MDYIKRAMSSSEFDQIIASICTIDQKPNWLKFYGIKVQHELSVEEGKGIRFPTGRLFNLFTKSFSESNIDPDRVDPGQIVMTTLTGSAAEFCIKPAFRSVGDFDVMFNYNHEIAVFEVGQFSEDIVNRLDIRHENVTCYKIHMEKSCPG